MLTLARILKPCSGPRIPNTAASYISIRSKVTDETGGVEVTGQRQVNTQVVLPELLGLGG